MGDKKVYIVEKVFDKPESLANRCKKLNEAPAFQALSEIWLGVIGADLSEYRDYIINSCPIILAKGPRSGHAKVVRELCEKTYNFSRKERYYGIKLHAVIARIPGQLPSHCL